MACGGTPNACTDSASSHMQRNEVDVCPVCPKDLHRYGTCIDADHTLDEWRPAGGPSLFLPLTSSDRLVAPTQPRVKAMAIDTAQGLQEAACFERAAACSREGLRVPGLDQMLAHIEDGHRAAPEQERRVRE